MKVYFDNAATTPIDEVVFEEMKPYMLEHFGNPSSIHSHGRQVRAAIERSRKKVADLLNTSPSEIFFTSGGTEADNTAIRCAIEAYGIQKIITTPLEHHAVLHTVQALEKQGKEVHYLAVDEKGQIDINEIEAELKKEPNTLVTLMHANNEIGTLNDIYAIAELCHEYGAIFHSDTVQSMAHYRHDLQELKANFIVGSAHKFHGPKGIGFLYVNHEKRIAPFIHGGAQERNMRGGTENVYGIIGLAKALEMAYSEMDEHRKQIESVKSYMIGRLKDQINGIEFNGTSEDVENSLYTVLSASLPPSDDNDMLLFNLDINGISASGGSACSSGSNIGSHVLTAIGSDPQRGAVRFSFSRFNTKQEVDYVVDKLNEILTVSV
ncbi:cysteine desulfurase family protein [Marinoscillum furvescens]|uniref:Cysteine desulfurase n=1 Tax=Marinoscillum furvescens DSM 4134 TaxID=1122208 RepID=A0A3D9L6R3_MARFU|nr:cysteine desulfurase family protein [Marinoscillum furvescens]REE00421.1 cysteine desulfurase [Marinoscillum furvescens DSM 4134]